MLFRVPGIYTYRIYIHVNCCLNTLRKASSSIPIRDPPGNLIHRWGIRSGVHWNLQTPRFDRFVSRLWHLGASHLVVEPSWGGYNFSFCFSNKEHGKPFKKGVEDYGRPLFSAKWECIHHILSTSGSLKKIQLQTFFKKIVFLGPLTFPGITCHKKTAKSSRWKFLFCHVGHPDAVLGRWCIVSRFAGSRFTGSGRWGRAKHGGPHPWTAWGEWRWPLYEWPIFSHSCMRKWFWKELVLKIVNRVHTHMNGYIVWDPSCSKQSGNHHCST